MLEPAQAPNETQRILLSYPGSKFLPQETTGKTAVQNGAELLRFSRHPFLRGRASPPRWPLPPGFAAAFARALFFLEVGFPLGGGGPFFPVGFPAGFPANRPGFLTGAPSLSPRGSESLFGFASTLRGLRGFGLSPLSVGATPDAGLLVASGREGFHSGRRFDASTLFRFPPLVPGAVPDLAASSGAVSNRATLVSRSTIISAPIASMKPSTLACAIST